MMALTTEEKAAEYDRLMGECRFATMEDIKYIMWHSYKKHRSAYGYDKPGADAGIASYDGTA